MRKSLPVREVSGDHGEETGVTGAGGYLKCQYKDQRRFIK